MFFLSNLVYIKIGTKLAVKPLKLKTVMVGQVMMGSGAGLWYHGGGGGEPGGKGLMCLAYKVTKYTIVYLVHWVGC